MALIRLILNRFWSSNSQIDIVLSKESNGIIRFSYWYLVLPLLGKQTLGHKIRMKTFVERPIFNRKHQENGHLEPFPYKSWYKLYQ